MGSSEIIVPKVLISTYIYHIFLPIFMYISTYFHVYFYLFLHIYSYLYIFLPIFTYIYHISVVFYYSLPQKCGIYVNYIDQSESLKCARKTGTNKLCAQSARFLVLIWQTIYSSPRWQIFDILKNFNTPYFLFRSYLER